MMFSEDAPLDGGLKSVFAATASDFGRMADGPMAFSIHTICSVCGNENHKVSEMVDNKIKFYCPTCDENTWVEQYQCEPISISPKIIFR